MYDSPPFGGLPVKFYKLGGVRFRPDDVVCTYVSTQVAVETGLWGEKALHCLKRYPVSEELTVILKDGRTLRRMYAPQKAPRGFVTDGNTP